MDTPILCGRSLATLLRGVHPEWLRLFDMEVLTDVLKGIEKKLAGKMTSPVPELIFEPFRYSGPSEQDIVIIGQDPYPDEKQAQGLCFSGSRTVKVPNSCKKIFECLKRAGLMYEIVCGDLRMWAAQNILMINTAFTTQCGVRRGHLVMWKRFTTLLFDSYCRLRTHVDTETHVLVWGGEAGAYAPIARRHGHTIHSWSHPSPLGDNMRPPDKRFVHCTHFDDVNNARIKAGRPPIIWDNQAAAIGFSDGGCPRNGYPGARASFAVFVAGAAFGKTTVSGLVEPCEYEFVDPEYPSLGIRSIKETNIRPTNNRGEWLAIIYGFLVALRGRIAGSFELCSDSRNCIMTLQEWYADRVKKGTEHMLKNQDLLLIALSLHKELDAQTATTTLTHCRGHQKKPPPTASSRVRYIREGNYIVDAMATKILKAPHGDVEDYTVTVVSPLASVCQLATSKHIVDSRTDN